MRNSSFHLLFFILLALQLTSCVTTHNVNYLQSPANFVKAYKDSVPYQDYRLKVGDKLIIQVYSMDDKTNSIFNGMGGSQGSMQSMSGDGENSDLYSYILNSKGAVTLPIIGDVELKGKTIREAKGVLEEAIRPILKINSVDVRTIGRYFNVIGAGKSGRFPITKEKINIFQAIALAGDLGFYTDKAKIRILRETQNGPIVKSFDARSVDIIHSEFYYIEPNDVIFLQPMKQQFLGVTTLWGAISTVVTTYAFGVIIYRTFLK